MSEIPPPDPLPPSPVGSIPPVDYASLSAFSPTQDEKNMAMLTHVLGILTGFLGPLIVWLLKKDSSKYIDDQGKEALNFWLCLTILAIVCSFTAFLCVPAIIAVVAWIAGIIFGIMGAVAASKGQTYRYPVNFRLIK